MRTFLTLLARCFIDNIGFLVVALLANFSVPVVSSVCLLVFRVEIVGVALSLEVLFVYNALASLWRRKKFVCQRARAFMVPWLRMFRVLNVLGGDYAKRIPSFCGTCFLAHCFLELVYFYYPPRD